MTFLNEQMLDIEVLAVEIKRFQGETNQTQTLVPRVIGRSTRRVPGNQGRGTRTTRESFLDAFADERVAGVANALLDVAQKNGAKIEYGRTGPTIRVRCEGIRQPITVAWLYPRKDIRWMRTREFTFGTALYELRTPPRQALTCRRGTCTSSATAAFTRDVSSKGVQAWAIGHEAAVDHREALTDLLQRIITGLAS